MEDHDGPLERLITKVTRLEAKMDLIVQMIAANNGREVVSRPAGRTIEKLTTKQHAALQMLFNGASNHDIADRFEVSPNTAKVYVRGIASKLGVATRNQIVVMCFEDFQNIEDDEYRLLSGGLPKDWHNGWEDPDPYKALYATKTR